MLLIVKIFIVLFELISPSTAQKGICGYNATASNVRQTLTSPGWPSRYGSDLNCEWMLTAKEGFHVALTFHSFQTEAPYDYLTIIGTGLEVILHGAKTLLPHFFSANSTLTLHFVSDESVQEEGFNASFTEIASLPVVSSTTRTITKRPRTCGFDVMARNFSQPFTSPGYPEKYADNLDCQWTISAREGHFVKLVFDVFSTESTFDVLNITGASTPLELSGLLTHNTFFSRNESLILRFSSDSSTSASGFEATFIEIDALPSSTSDMQEETCEFRVTATNFEQPITSPDWPNLYGNNLHCEWHLTARPDFRIKLTFEVFNTERNYDILQILGLTTTREELSGNLIFHDSFYSETNILVLQFDSDASTQMSGFRAMFVEVSASTKTTFAIETSTITIRDATCRFISTATSTNKTLSSPGWPNCYRNNEDCEWTLTARDGYHVNLTFLTFATEPLYDFVTLTGSSTAAWRLSGNLLIDTYYSVNSTLTIHFSTDESTVDKGFTAIFTEIESIPLIIGEPCGFNETAKNYTETLTTPHYPERYGPNLNCEWHLTTQEGFQVQLKIEMVDTEAVYDILAIIGASLQPQILSGSRRITGSYYSLDQRLVLQFLSDHAVHGSGVNATFKRVKQEDVPHFTAATEICMFNDIAQSIARSIVSPGWPENYYDNLDCQWNLKSEKGLHVKLMFDEFQIEDQEDFIRVIGSQQNPLLLFFGLIHLVPFYSIGDNLTLIFKTNWIDNLMGFRATFIAYTCDNGDVIRESQICDGISDCDGSEEVRSAADCKDTGNGQLNCTLASTRTRNCLISKDAVCNKSIALVNARPCNLKCPSHYRCQNGKCVERSTVCDRNKCNGCSEDKEWRTGIGFQCIRNGEKCLLPQQLLWDGIKDCDQGEDLCYISSSHKDGRDLRNLLPKKFDYKRCFKCFDGSMIIPRSKVCDGVFQCSDLSDECLCEGDVPSLCQHVIKHTSNQTLKLKTTNSTCAVGNVICTDGSCIDRSNVCDSVGDCSDNMDEKDAYCKGTLQCKHALPADQGKRCRCPEYDCKEASYGDFSRPIDNMHGITCDRNRECPPADRFTTTLTEYFERNWKEGLGYPADECEAHCTNAENVTCTTDAFGDIYDLRSAQPTQLCRTYGLPLLVKKCDGIRQCIQRFHDEINCTERHYCTSGDRLSISKEEVCDGRVNCEDGSDEAHTACPHRLYCPSLSNALVSVDPLKICDGNIDCDNNIDEINCTNDGRFYCENGDPLFVTEKKIFDGRQDCKDWSDECPAETELKKEDVFSSRYQLIANPIFRYLVWIMGIFALFGNLTVIIGEGKSLSKIMKKGGSAPSRANHMLVFNLALADTLMGVYLIMLGIAGIVYDGVFCLYDTAWLTSIACSAMGVLVVLSSETSVITMVILTVCRLYGVLQPFKSRKKPTVFCLFVCIASAWLVSGFIALLPFIPCFESVFVSKVLIYDNPFFQNATVTFDSAKDWGTKMLTYHPQYENSSEEKIELIQDANSWYDLQDILGERVVSELLNVTKQFGFYSANSVCIPRLFVTRKDKAWGFVMSTTIFNFLAFTFVASAYVYILVKTNKQGKQRAKMTKRSRKNDKATKAIQNKVLRLVATDFCCWVPISILAFINFSGFPLFDVVYVISAIVLLPINSALNPILYSDFVDKAILAIKNQMDDSARGAASRRVSTRSTNEELNV